MVHFVGAGSGAPDLITLRGARLLGEADVVIYAGSLVNPELLTLTKPGCEVHDSAKLTLEEVIALIERAEREGKTTVRLHTGDPSIYGAVREQFDALTERGIDFDVCPGVSSFCGAAAALRAGERQLEGGQSRFIRKAQEDLTALLSGLEAHIDYPDEIGEDEALSGLCEGLDKLIARLDGAIDERGARIVREGLRVALCGRPNAGKSTLFNALLGEDRAIVTDIPGTTRDVLEGAFMLDGTNVLLQDTAGLRDSGDAVERIGVERARAALGRADVALLVVDASQDPDDEALDLLRMEAPCPCAVLLNKEDAGERFTASQAERLTDKRPILRVSAREGEGLDAVREYLRGFLRNPDELALTHERHMAVARQALDKLRDARAGLASGGLIDLAAVDLHEALYLLGRITGDSVDEKLLDDIFSRFCVGK